jgi:hypothetical protein
LAKVDGGVRGERALHATFVFGHVEVALGEALPEEVGGGLAVAVTGAHGCGLLGEGGHGGSNLDIA